MTIVRILGRTGLDFIVCHTTTSTSHYLCGDLLAPVLVGRDTQQLGTLDGVRVVWPRSSATLAPAVRM
jgi:hypothetical protein